MSTSYFVKAMAKMAPMAHEEADRIPGTSKIRTYCADASLYSSESDLKSIIRPGRRGGWGFTKEH